MGKVNIGANFKLDAVAQIVERCSALAEGSKRLGLSSHSV